jgi:hypothetical protein
MIDLYDPQFKHQEQHLTSLPHSDYQTVAELFAKAKKFERTGKVWGRRYYREFNRYVASVKTS